MLKALKQFPILLSVAAPLVESDKETDEENYLMWRLEKGIAEGSTEIPKGAFFFGFLAIHLIFVSSIYYKMFHLSGLSFDIVIMLFSGGDSTRIQFRRSKRNQFR